MQNINSFAQIVENLQTLPAFAAANEDAQLLAVFVTHEVCERSRAKPRYGNGTCVVQFEMADSKNRYPVVIERLNKTDGGITISMALSPDDVDQQLKPLLVKGRPPYIRVRSAELESEKSLIGIILQALQSSQNKRC